MKRFDDERKIYVDADVLRHFIRAKQQHKLSQIYPDRLILLNIVELEIVRDTRFQSVISSLKKGSLDWEDFPDIGDVYDTYIELCQNNVNMGEGEAACLASAHHNNAIIASSNMRDIVPTCNTRNIDFLTSTDILLYAEDKGILTEDECNDIISINKKAGSPMPNDTLVDYRLRIGEPPKTQIK